MSHPHAIQPSISVCVHDPQESLMEFITSLLGSKKPQHLPPVEGDEIYPFHFLDNSGGLVSTVLANTFFFNDVLDADKLHSTLREILDNDDWRKLGGRIRRGRNGKLESHVPVPFTASRAPVNYSHQKFDMDFVEHPLAPKFPKRTEGVVIQDTFADIRPFALAEGAPETLDDFLSRDVSMLSVIVSSFNDATIVGLSFPHCMSDAMGMKELIQAWSLTLAGRQSEVSPLQGTRTDLLYEAAGSPQAQSEEYVNQSSLISGLRMIWFGIKFVIDILTYSKMRAGQLYLRKEIVHGLRQQVLEEINGDDPDVKQDHWVSEADVILALLVRSSALGRTRPPPVLILNALNVRARMPTFLDKAGAYVQNMALFSLTTIPVTILKHSLGQVALAYRQALQSQTPEPQLLAYLRSLRTASDKGGEFQMPLYGSPSAMLFIMSNWSQCDFAHVMDFSAAVVKQGEADQTRTNPVGYLDVNVTAITRTTVVSERNCCVVSTDYAGNYWLLAGMVPKAWDLVAERLKEAEASLMKKQ